jgi:hypothetical protein
LTTGAHDLRIDDVHQGPDVRSNSFGPGDDPLEPVPPTFVLWRPSASPLFNRMFFRGRDIPSPVGRVRCLILLT